MVTSHQSGGHDSPHRAEAAINRAHSIVLSSRRTESRMKAIRCGRGVNGLCCSIFYWWLAGENNGVANCKWIAIWRLSMAIVTPVSQPKPRLKARHVKLGIKWVTEGEGRRWRRRKVPLEPNTDRDCNKTFDSRYYLWLSAIGIRYMGGCLCSRRPRETSAAWECSYFL